MAAESELYVIASVAGQHLGVRAGEVLKVLEVGAVARIPRLPKAIVGITPLRGRIVTVIDLAVLLGKEPCAAVADAARRILLLDSGSRNVGLLVDEVETIAKVDRVESRRGADEEDFVVRIARCGAHTVGLVDGARLSRKIAGVCRPAGA